MIIVATCRSLICCTTGLNEVLKNAQFVSQHFSKTRSTFWAIPRLFERLFFIHVFVVRFTVAQDNFRTGRRNINYCPAHSYTTSLTQGKTISSNGKKKGQN